MHALTIALALSEIMPILRKWIRHPRRGRQLVQSMSSIACHLTQETDPQLIQEALRNDPELLLEFYKKLIDTEKDMYIAMLNDREHARQRTSKRQSHMMLAVALVGLVICFMLLHFCHFPSEAVGMVTTMCGIFGACLKDIYAFEFSSHQHRDQFSNKFH